MFETKRKMTLNQVIIKSKNNTNFKKYTLMAMCKVKSNVSLLIIKFKKNVYPFRKALISEELHRFAAFNVKVSNHHKSK